MTRKLSLCLFFGLISLNAADLGEARRLMESKRVPEALPLIEQYLQSHPKDQEAKILQGQCQLEMLDSEKAMETLETAVELGPRNSKAQALLGNALIAEASRKSSLSYARKGKAALEKAIELDPKNIDALDALAYFYSVAPWIAGGDTDRAHVLVKRLLALDPVRGFAVDVGLLAKEKKYDEALRLCEQSLARDSENYVYLYEFGRICGMASKRQSEGIIALEKCLKKEPPQQSVGHDWANFRLAVLHKQLGHVDQANSYFDQAAQLGAMDSNFVARVAKARK